MTLSIFAARASIGAAVLALVALAALHILKPEIHPSRAMISQYALGRHGWVMALCFAAFAAASACLFAALVPQLQSLPSRIGLGFLLSAALGLAMAACFPMDPASTPSRQMSFSGRMHGVSFLIGVPSQTIAVLLLSLGIGSETSQPSLPLLVLTSIIWLSLIFMMAIMSMAGHGKTANPDGPQSYLGWPNRLFMVSYGIGLLVAAWRMTS
jgi:hypothetical protein